MMRRMSQVAIVLAVACWVAEAVHADSPRKQPPSPAPQALAATEQGGWIFRAGTYSHNPRTGKRVWQYQPMKKVYRDPNAVFDSDTGTGPFAPEAGEMEMFYRPYGFFGPYVNPYYGAYWPYGPFEGYNPYGSYSPPGPLDTDPNQTSQSGQMPNARAP